MKLTVQASTLLDGLRSVQARTKKQGSIIPILGHIRLAVDGDRFTVFAHDLDACCEATVAADIHDGGRCALPGDALVSLVAALPKETHLTIEADEKSATIKAGRSRYKLPSMPPAELPDALPCDDAETVELSDADVKQLFERPLSAMDKTTKRVQISGGWIHGHNGKLCVIGTDAIHMVCYATDVNPKGLPEAVVPAAAMVEIGKLGAGKLSIGKNTVAYETNRCRFVSKLVDAQFPPARQAMPSLSPVYVDVDRAELLTAVSRLCTVAKSDSEIYLTFGDGEITASVSGEGDGSETVSSSGEAGDEIVCISAVRLREILAMPKGEVIQLHLEKGRNVLRIADASEPSSIFVEWCRLPKKAQAA